MGMGRAGRAARPPRLPPGGGILPGGAAQRGYRRPVLPFWRHLCPAEPSAGDFPHAAVAGNLLSAHLRHHPEHGGAPGGHRVVPHDRLWGHLPPVRGGTGAILLRPVLRNLRKLGTAPRLTLNPEKSVLHGTCRTLFPPQGAFLDFWLIFAYNKIV